MTENWPMKVKHEIKVGITEMSTIRCACGLTLKERKKEKCRTQRTVGAGTSQFGN